MMPGPVSQSYDGPSDKSVPFPPRWAYEHLTDEEYAKLKREHDGKTGRKNPTKKLSIPQQRALFKLQNGHPIDYGIRGRSDFGGLRRTIHALMKLGLIGSIDGDLKLTNAGRMWLDDDENSGYRMPENP